MVAKPTKDTSTEPAAATSTDGVVTEVALETTAPVAGPTGFAESAPL